MNEIQLINIIKTIVGDKYIGDDCAYLEDLGIVVSQDSLVEGVHFKLEWLTPIELGAKSALVNISDVLASGAKPCYITVSLSMPSKLDENFVKDFYSGFNSVCKRYGVQVVGGDLTGADKVFVSVCILGNAEGRNISSRKNAKENYDVYIAGVHGESSLGLRSLLENEEMLKPFVRAHKSPRLCGDLAFEVSNVVREPYAMMDTSDGLADALFKIAKASEVSIHIDFSKIPCSEALRAVPDYRKSVLFGGEDYGLIAVVPSQYALRYGTKIGEVHHAGNYPLVVENNGKILRYSSIDEFTYKHFS